MGKTKADLEREIETLKSRLAQSAGVPPKEREATETRATAARAAVEGISVESVVKDITDVSLSTGRAFSNLTEMLTAKTKLLEEIDLAIRVKEQDLEQLYGKETVGSALAALVENYEKQKQEIQAEIAAMREQVLVEAKIHAKALEDRDAETAKARAREADQFAYTRDTSRRLQQQTWQQEIEDRKRAETIRMGDFERAVQEREAALKAREVEFAAAKVRIDNIQNEIDAAIKKEVAIVTNAIVREHKHATELALRDHSGELKAAQAQAEAARLENQRLLAMTASLTSQVAEAYAKNVSLSEKALEAASGRQALTELRDLQTVRAENNGQGRKS